MFLDLFLTASLANDYKLSDLKTIGISSIRSGDRHPEVCVFEPESRCGQGGALAGAVCSRGSCPWPLLVAASILRLVATSLQALLLWSHCLLCVSV